MSEIKKYKIECPENCLYEIGEGIDKCEEPIETITELPAMLEINTRDCWDGNLTEDTDDVREIAKQLAKPMNPCTGPIKFEGVKAGDVLKIEIKDIVCECGSIMTIDFEGVCKDIVSKVISRLYRKGNMNSPKENEIIVEGEYPNEKHMMLMSKCDEAGNVTGEFYRKEMTPMIGVIGVVPAGGPYPTAAPGNWGGNMDTTLIKRGATLYLPVQVDGGMLYTGDAHITMGEGEQYTTGLEADATFTLCVSKCEMKIDTPFVKVDGRVSSIFTADDKNTDAAFRGAMKKYIQFIVDNTPRKDMDYNEAGILCGLFGDLEVSQIADDPYRTARMAMDEELLKEHLGIVMP